MPVWMLVPLFAIFSISYKSNDYLIPAALLSCALLVIFLVGYVLKIKRAPAARERAFAIGNLQFGLLQLLWIVMALPFGGNWYLPVLVSAVLLLVVSPLPRGGDFYLFPGVYALMLLLIIGWFLGSGVAEDGVCTIGESPQPVPCSLSALYFEPVLAGIVILTLLSAGENFFKFLFLSSVFFGGLYFIDVDRSIRLTAFLGPFIFYPGNPVYAPSRWLLMALSLMSIFFIALKFPLYSGDSNVSEYFSNIIIVGFFALEFLFSGIEWVFSRRRMKALK
jgi:hypothetical protein